jgi:hypothetical protein
MYLHSHKKKCDHISECYHWAIMDIKSLGTMELTDFKGNKYRQHDFYCTYFQQLILHRQHVVTNLGHLQAFYHKGWEYTIPISVLNNRDFNFIFNVVQYSAVQYSTVRYGTVRYSTVQYGMVQYGTVQYGTVQYGTVWYSTVRYGTVQYSTVRYGTVRYMLLIIFIVI